ncbi:MAG: cell division protein FtsQ [Micrococcales bacterium]|nr:MAG: cell division protein FtsQ [Micrococcales bacterium]
MLGTVLMTGLVAWLGWLIGFSPVLAVKSITVYGTDRQNPAAVQDLLGSELDKPLARVDLDRIRQRVQTLPAVKTADVVRTLPNTLEIRVVERVPLAAVEQGDRFALLDADGVRLAEEPKAPAELPLITASTLAEGQKPVAAVLDSLQEMPPELRRQIGRGEAETQDSVQFTLASGSTVVWGSSEESARKAEVLAALVQREASVYDVSAPRTPVTR